MVAQSPRSIPGSSRAMRGRRDSRGSRTEGPHGGEAEEKDGRARFACSRAWDATCEAPAPRASRSAPCGGTHRAGAATAPPGKEEAEGATGGVRPQPAGLLPRNRR